MTKQEYYDLLAGMERPGWDEKQNRCAYRGSHGSRCAFGVLIPDKDYRPDMEGQLLRGLPDELVAKVTPVGMSVNDLVQVQIAHDVAANDARKRRLGNFHVLFVRNLNKLRCFQDVRRVQQPMEVPA